MSHDTPPGAYNGMAFVPNPGGGAKIYVMPGARRPTTKTLHQDTLISGCVSSASSAGVNDGYREEGRVLQFPVRKSGRCDAEIRTHLGRLGARTPSIQPLLFGHDERGIECCRFGNGLMMSWGPPDRMILTDTYSGYVDYGPFDSLDEICLLIVGLDS